MTTTDKLQGTCSVCLRKMQLRGDRPIRHGFRAVGVRHGQTGGWHTGPCRGVDFPHLGISDEGTRWALRFATEKLLGVNDELARLATHPDFTWYPMDFRTRKPDYSKPIVLRYGVETPFGQGAPSYDRYHKGEVATAEASKRAIERAIADYENVLATWSPGKYPVTGAAAKVETTHMATPRKNSRGQEWNGVLCRFTKPGYASSKLPKTDDPGKVTCKRCRSALGLPPL